MRQSELACLVVVLWLIPLKLPGARERSERGEETTSWKQCGAIMETKTIWYSNLEPKWPERNKEDTNAILHEIKKVEVASVGKSTLQGSPLFGLGEYEQPVSSSQESRRSTKCR